MKNKTAKTISVLMALLMIASTVFAITFNVQADTSKKCGDDLVWSLDYYGILRISGVGNMDNYSYYGKTPWYQGRDNIKKVIIENGVTSIGDNAFYECENLVEVVIPPSVTTIGEYAFCGCYALKSVTIPSQVTQIGEYALGYYLYTELVWGTEIDYDEITGESIIIHWDRDVIEERKIDGFKILCYLNSEGARYAAENNIDYEYISADTHKKGDINDDDSIDSTDLILLKKYLLGQTTFDAIEYSCADIDNNDEINVTDYLFIKRSQLKISIISDDGYYLGEDISVYRQYPDKELESRIKNDYLKSIDKNDKYTEDQVIIKNFMGPFNDCYIMKIATSDAEALAVITEETVAHVKFINRTSQKLTVWKDGAFYTLSGAYEQQLLSEKEIIIASKLYYNLDPELKFEN